MRAKTVETLAWTLIYSGLLIGALGWFVQDRGMAVGWVMLLVGLSDAVAGVVLIWHRSRMDEQPSQETR